MKTKNLYSVQRFTLKGGAIVHEQAKLAVGEGEVNDSENAWLAPPQDLLKLEEGQDAVIGVKYGGTASWMIEVGYRITRLPSYRQGRICYDQHAKEYLSISNGRSVAGGIGRDETFAPSEAIALRPFVENGKVSLAWTCRAVNPCDLRPVADEQPWRESFDAVLAKRRSKRFIGRI